ncbi:MAG: hypothetical protein KGQ59_12095 [Bdellovibrionales bacterium]|nr:hypothetical protein [Bdellovibrionales bacterium]
MKFETKQVQQELKQGYAWPVYWVYGAERLLIRELLSRLKKAIIGDNAWCEERLDGSITTAAEVVAAAQSIPFGGGTRFVMVRDAHLIKEPEQLTELFGDRAKLSELPYVCVFVAKDLDARRKFSKTLLEKAAVVPCEAIPEHQREVWLQYLCSTLGVPFDLTPRELLLRFEPWSLEWAESELLKWALANSVEPGLGDQVVVGGTDERVSSELFIESFLEHRSLSKTLSWVSRLAKRPEDSLPLLGLLSWNVRMMALAASKSRTLRLPPFVESKIVRSLRAWSLNEILDLQASLSSLDFALKQTPQEPLALWGVLVSDYCRK